jgi:hypothetical protein
MVVGKRGGREKLERGKTGKGQILGVPRAGLAARATGQWASRLRRLGFTVRNWAFSCVLGFAVLLFSDFSPLKKKKKKKKKLSGQNRVDLISTRTRLYKTQILISYVVFVSGSRVV